MADMNAPAPVNPPASNVLEFTLPESAGSAPVSIDLAAIPADTRMELLKNGVKSLISGRVNVATVRYNKAIGPFLALDAYNAAAAAYAADPLTNPQPAGAAPTVTGERPAPVDVAAKVSEAVAALLAGRIGREKSDTPSTRVAKDPVDKIVTGVVVGEVFKKNKALDAKYTYPQATKEVGASGVAYLKTRIDSLVEAGSDRAALEKMLETKYLAPARQIAGVDALKGKNAELPNIL